MLNQRSQLQLHGWLAHLVVVCRVIRRRRQPQVGIAGGVQGHLSALVAVVCRVIRRRRQPQVGTAGVLHGHWLAPLAVACRVIRRRRQRWTDNPHAATILPLGSAMASNSLVWRWRKKASSISSRERRWPQPVSSLAEGAVALLGDWKASRRLASMQRRYSHLLAPHDLRAKTFPLLLLVGPVVALMTPLTSHSVKGQRWQIRCQLLPVWRTRTIPFTWLA